MVLLVFGPKTASFAKWLKGRSEDGLILLRDHEVKPETLEDYSLIYSYGSPFSMKRLAGSEGLRGPPILVYQPWLSIRNELVSKHLRWRAKEMTAWVNWASRLLVPTTDLTKAVDILSLDDFQVMTAFFPQKSCRKALQRWIGKIFSSDTASSLIPLEFTRALADFQCILLP
jgi:hypothetical protein